MDTLQGRSQDSVNGGAQFGAVTRPYIYKVEYNREKYRSFIGPVRRGMLPQKFFDFRLSEMVSDALLNKKEPANA